MAFKFVAADRDAPFLMPPSVQDWLPDGHLAQFVVDVVHKLDISNLEKSYSGRGSPAFHPSVLLALLFYGYATGVFSSRKLEAASYDSVAFRYICANTHPDHDTIATFRKRFLPELQDLFVQILLVAQTMGVLRLGQVSLDGTKVKANASKHKALSYAHARKLEQQLRAEVAQLLGKAAQADREDGPDEMDLPEELRRRQERLAAIERAKAEIERRAAERFAREKEAYDEKLAQRRRKEQQTGQKARGREPTPPEPGPKASDQVNLTDEASRIMPVSGGGFEQTYNAQAAVDMASLLIVENHVSQNPNDKKELTPALEGLDALPRVLGRVTDAVADNGYFSQANVDACAQRRISPLLTPKRDAHNLPLAERWAEPHPLPEGADALARMQHRLQTQAGKALYARRKSTVEPRFGIIKAVMGFRQFLLRGLHGVQGEWTLVCIACNIRRLHVLTAAAT
jgi:transposase